MPIVIPTAEEVRQMDHRQRETWRRRMGIAQHEIQQTVRLLKYGDVVLVEARKWFDFYGPDPDAKKHQAVLLEWV